MNVNHSDNTLIAEASKLPVCNGISVSDIVRFPESIGGIIQMIVKKGEMSLTDLSQELGLSMDEAHRVMEILIQKGCLISEERQDMGVVYRVYIARIRGRNIPAIL